MIPISYDAPATEPLSARQKPPSSREAISRGILHDLNNIFSSLTIATQLLRQELPEERRGRLVDSVASATERGRALVEELGRHRARRSEETIAFDPKIVIEAVARAARERLSGTCAVETEYEPALPRVEGNPDRLFQRLYSLLEALSAQDEEGTVAIRGRLLGDGDTPGRAGTIEILVEQGCGSGPSALLPFVPPAGPERDGSGIEVVRTRSNCWMLRLAPTDPRT